MNSTLLNNTYFNNIRGIVLRYTDHTIITNNTCYTNSQGIHLYRCDSVTLSQNTLRDNNIGIYSSASDYSVIINNTCSNNSEGIRDSSSRGVFIAENICSKNIYGIYLSGTDYSTITSNSLEENSNYGIYLVSGCNDNLIHHNLFLDNNPSGTSQACDDGVRNIWFDETSNEGNHWTDWIGLGSYSIDGSAGSVDPFPLDEEGNPPSILEFKKSITMLALLPLLIIFPIILKRKRSCFRIH
jgi:parallel beta-helix repeat protein